MKDADVNPLEGSETATAFLRAAQAADPLAWETLVKRYGAMVFRWAKKSVPTEEDAADILQNVLLKVSRKLPEFQRDQTGDTFRGWLRRITQNAVTDFFRKQGREISVEKTGGTDHHRAIESIAPDWTDNSRSLTGSLCKPSLHAEAIRRVQEHSSAEHWLVFTRYVIEGDDPDQIAKEMGFSRGKVYTIKFRIAQRIKDEYERLSAELAG